MFSLDVLVRGEASDILVLFILSGFVEKGSVKCERSHIYSNQPTV